MADFEAYTQRELPRMFWAALEEVVSSEMQPIEERLRGQLLGMIRDCQGRVFSTYQSMVVSNINTLHPDHPTKEVVTNSFKPLTRTTSLKTSFTNISNSELPNYTPSNDFNSSEHEVNLSGFESSTTLSSFFASSTALSSVFNSSTTLSSVTSADPRAPTNSGIDAQLEDIDEISTYNFDITNKDLGATEALGETWITDLDEVDLRQLEAMGTQFATDPEV
jgi:hypothetical protein